MNPIFRSTRRLTPNGAVFCVLVCLSALAIGCSGDDPTTPPADNDLGAADIGNADTGLTADTAMSSSGADVAADTAAVEDTGKAGDDTSSSSGDTGSGSSADTAGSSSGVDTGGSSSGVDAGGSSSSGVDTAAPPKDTTTGPLTIDKYSEHSAKCSADADCKIPCGKGQCSQGKCAFIPHKNACLVEVGTDKVGCYGHGLQGDKSKCLQCNTDVSQETLTSVAELLAIDDDTNGIKTEDLSKGGVLWTLSSKRSVSGGSSLYFGDPKSHVYANDKHVKASATTPELSVPKFANAKPEISFWLWLATEESKGYDYLKVEVLAAGAGKTPVVEQVWHSDSIGGTTHGIWKSITLDASKWQGSKVQVRFTFDSIDTFVNAFEGAYVDSISVRTGCCGSTADCNDGNSCSADTCAAKAGSTNPVCGHDLKKACCNSAADCDDGKACTLDICSGKGGTCSHNAKPGCCNVSKDCDDKDSCTIDHCPKAGSQCQHTNTCCKGDGECNSEDPCLVGGCNAGECTYTSVCCNNDVECDDFNTCTLDVCDGGKCKHNPALVPGCCSPVPWAAEFESDIKGWTPDPAKDGMIWEYQKYKAGVLNAGTGALKFGMKGKDKFSNHPKYSYGYVLSPVITLPANQDAELEIGVSAEISISSGTPSTLNRIYVYALDESKKTTTLGYQYLNKTGKFVFKKDISAFGGSKFQLRLRGYIYGFTSKPVSGSGPRVDYVRIKTNCAPKTCANDKSCNPYFMPCLQGFCTGGTCSFNNKCCKTNADCKSNNLCLSGTCSGTTCKLVKKPGCCMADADCNDKVGCTTDKCSKPGGTCSHTALKGCTEPYCGDGKCQKDKENCATCVKDCGKCVGCGANPAATCMGKCGKYTSGAKCQCDSACKSFNDCCGDLGKCCP